MSQQVHPTTLVLPAQNMPAPSTTLTINNSLLHSSYQSNSHLDPAQADEPVCFHCQEGDHEANHQLVCVCDCQWRVYHERCLRVVLGQKLEQQECWMRGQDGCTHYKCEDCSYEIKFRYVERTRRRTCKQVREYCIKHRLMTGMIGLCGALLCGCLLGALLLFLRVIQMEGNRYEREVLMIALAVVGGVLLIVELCCMVECIRVEEKKIDTMYSRQGRSHRSARSRLSNHSNISNNATPRSRQSQRTRKSRQVVVVSIE